MPPSRTSSTRQSGVCAGGSARNSSADEYAAVANPPARSTRPSALRSAASSSMTTTSGVDVSTVRVVQGTANREVGPLSVGARSLSESWHGSDRLLGVGATAASGNRVDIQPRGQPHEVGDRPCLELRQDAVAVRLDRALARAQVERNLLVQLTGDQMREDQIGR